MTRKNCHHCFDVYCAHVYPMFVCSCFIRHKGNKVKTFCSIPNNLKVFNTKVPTELSNIILQILMGYLHSGAADFYASTYHVFIYLRSESNERERLLTELKKRKLH